MTFVLKIITLYRVSQKNLYLLAKQLENGSPVNPDGQLHVTLCCLTSHTALVAHGFATMHGFMQFLSLQISLSPHSLFDLQPGSGLGAIYQNIISICLGTEHMWYAIKLSFGLV